MAEIAVAVRAGAISIHFTCAAALLIDPLAIAALAIGVTELTHAPRMGRIHDIPPTIALDTVNAIQNRATPLFEIGEFVPRLAAAVGILMVGFVLAKMVERGKDHLGALCVVAANLAERALRAGALTFVDDSIATTPEATIAALIDAVTGSY